MKVLGGLENLSTSVLLSTTKSPSEKFLSDKNRKNQQLYISSGLFSVKYESTFGAAGPNEDKGTRQCGSLMCF